MRSRVVRIVFGRRLRWSSRRDRELGRVARADCWSWLRFLVRLLLHDRPIGKAWTTSLVIARAMHGIGLMQSQQSQADLETTNRLRRTVAESARLPAWLNAEDAVAAVMCVLTERLTAGGAHELVGAIPRPVRRRFESCALHREGKRTMRANRAEFLAMVADHLGVTPAHAELVSSAVFTAIRAELPGEVIMAIAAQLPRGLKELWLGPPISAPDLDVEIAPEDSRQAIENDLARRARLPSGVRPAQAFSGVMCTFARRLSGGAVRDVMLGFPLVVRQLLEHCAAHEGEYAEIFGRDRLIRDIGEHLRTNEDDTRRIVGEVLRSAKRVLPQQTIAEIESQLPPDLVELWRDALPPHQ